MLFERFWTGVATLMGWLTISTIQDHGPQQIAIGSEGGRTTQDPIVLSRPPIFAPPGGDRTNPFTCDYTAMGPDWEPCSIPENRECWLRNKKTGEEYNIHTNYENFAPKGIVRSYYLEVTDSWVNAAGINFTAAKLFNDTWPAPWIQACWGDTLNITVVNKMRFNGTSIHFHGIRQNQTMHMDGVNGVTQCPIAPNDHFTYEFQATQYGSTWYHSHYSVQYADGLHGPMSIHGPASAAFDYPVEPLLLTDWNHASAFEILNNGAAVPPERRKTSILLNGRGDVTRHGPNRLQRWRNEIDIPPPYTLVFESNATITRPKRYLLRIINTSWDAAFSFSIDNHWLQVIGADFVPIEPYWTTSVRIGIGQRYHVIVEADPKGARFIPVPKDGNFWIRTQVLNGCGTAQGYPGYEKQGIIRYNADSKDDPTSVAWTNIPTECADEPYASLRPKIPWYVEPKPAKDELTTKHGDKYAINNIKGKYQTPPGLSVFKHAIFSFQKNDADALQPLRVNYSDPTFLELDHFNKTWNPEWAITEVNGTEKDWIFMVLSGDKAGRTFKAHPIHLHGHDFALIAQQEDMKFTPDYKILKPLLKLDNPPRRDVVLLPRDGFVIIAFKADNPGAWLIHCHIAFHASFGLGFQIMERQHDANRLWPKPKDAAIVEAQRVCKNWDIWERNCTKWWPGQNATGHYPACYDKSSRPFHPNDRRVSPFYNFEDDSGV